MNKNITRAKTISILLLTFLITLTSIMSSIHYSNTIVNAGWLELYDTRWTIPLTGAGSPPANYKVKVSAVNGGGFANAAGFVNLNGSSLNFPHDVRFTDDDETTKLNYAEDDMFFKEIEEIETTPAGFVGYQGIAVNKKNYFLLDNTDLDHNPADNTIRKYLKDGTIVYTVSNCHTHSAHLTNLWHGFSDGNIIDGKLYITAMQNQVPQDHSLVMVYNVGAHNIEDDTNLVTSAVASDQATLETLLNEVKADYNAHRIDTTSHDEADSTNAVESANASDLATAITLVNEIKADYNAHRSQTDVHAEDDSGNAITSATADDLAKCITMANEIKTDYNAHCAFEGVTFDEEFYLENEEGCEGIDKYDGYFWTVYWKRNVIQKWNSSFVLQDTYDFPVESHYPLSGTDTLVGFQTICFLEDKDGVVTNQFIVKPHSWSHGFFLFEYDSGNDRINFLKRGRFEDGIAGTPIARGMGDDAGSFWISETAYTPDNGAVRNIQLGQDYWIAVTDTLSAGNNPDIFMYAGEIADSGESSYADTMDFYSGFESDADFDQWTDRIETDTTLARSTDERYIEDYSAFFDDNSNPNNCRLRTPGALSELKYHARFAYRPMQDDKISKMYFSEKDDDYFVYLWFGATGDVRYYDTGFVDVVDYLPNVWHRMDIYADFDAYTFDLYMELVKQINGGDMRNSATGYTGFEVSTNDPTTSELYLDEVFIRYYIDPGPTIGTPASKTDITPCTPTLTTANASVVEETTATLNGTITDCCYNVTNRGFVWGTTTQGLPGNTTAPSATGYDSNWTESGNWGNVTLTHNVSALTQGELFYYRAAGNSTDSGHWGYGNESTFLTKPNDPTGLTNTSKGNTWIALSWSKGTGAQNTTIRYRTDQYPIDYSDGSSAYFDSGTTTNVTSIACNTSHYFRAWSYATEGGLEQYSDSYSQVLTSTRNLCTAVPTVITNNATSIEETNVTLNGNVTSIGGENNDEQGFYYDIDSGTPYANNQTSLGSFGTGEFTEDVTGLTKGELYYFQAISHNSAGWGNGTELQFLTKPDEPNTFSATDGTGEAIDLTWVKGDGALNTEIWGQSGSYPASRGTGTMVYNSTGTSYTDSNPSHGETWYYRAWSYATEGGLFRYSDTYIQDNALCSVTIPIVATNNATFIEETWATMNGNITSTEMNATVRGFQYDIDSGIPYSLNWTEAGSFGTDTFSYNATGLDEGELYYFRAKATNVGGQGNGSELTFLTKPDEPTAFLNVSRTSTSIATAWTVGDGSDFYIVRYSTSGYPADYSSDTMACNTSSSACNAIALVSGQVHYFRVWSWCTEGGLSQWSDTYDEVTAYTNPADITLFDAFNPSASTIDLSWIQGTGGDKTHIRGQQGSYPANVSTGTQIYFDTGASTTHIGLGSGETWYYRAWAYDSDSGYYSDSYDQDFEVTSSAGAPTVTTSAASLVEETTATANGEVTLINDTIITDRSFQWDTDSAPPYTFNWTQNGSFGLATFSYGLTNLSYGELYFVRALAENDNSIVGYGSEVQFLTKPNLPTGLASTNTTDDTVSLSWTNGNGSQKVMIRYATSGYPSDYNAGTQGYYGTGNTCIISSLDPGMTYYIRTWSYATEGGEVQYSDGYSQTTAITTGSSAASDPCSTAGVMALIVVAGAATAIPLAIKLQPMFIAGALAWFGLGIYLVSVSDIGAMCWVLGWVCLAAGLACAFELTRRMMKNRVVRATEDEEIDDYRDTIQRTIGE